MGFGLYHSGVEINGKEYAYGGDVNSAETGIFESEPRKASNYTFYQSYRIGKVRDIAAAYQILHELKQKYRANEYSLIHKNCNHFAEDLLMRLLGKGLPWYVNRPARMGTFVSFLLPESLKKLNSSVPASHASQSSAAN